MFSRHSNPNLQCVFCKKNIMKKQLLLLLAINFLFFLNSIGQSFYGLSDVISYTSGKVFSNTDNTVKIQIGYDGITVNDNLAYFNLEISVLNTNVALIKGYSLSNPDGTISFRLNSSTGCIVQGVDSYCQSKGTSTNTSGTSLNTSATYIDTSNLTESFKTQLPMTFSVKPYKKYPEPITFQKDGTGINGSLSFTWKVLNSNEIEIEFTYKDANSKVVKSKKKYTMQYIEGKFSYYESNYRTRYVQRIE